MSAIALKPNPISPSSVHPGVAADVDSMPVRRQSGTRAVRAESPKSRDFRLLMSLDVRTREEIAKLHVTEQALRDRLTEATARWLETYGRRTSDGSVAHHRFVWDGEVVRPVYRRIGKGSDRMSGFIQRFPPVGIDETPTGSDE